MGDCGLTGRKIIVDTYGGAAPHGGGAFSGKDPTKVDRSAAYAARYVAKNVVAAGLADRCQVQVAYAIGVAHPMSIHVDTFGTEKIPVRADRRAHPASTSTCGPAAILHDLDLRRPIYAKTAAYGHFGRDDPDFTWERDGQGRGARGGGRPALLDVERSDMAVTVVGSVAFDALETPFGTRERILGGAATHFSLAASFFTDVRVVGVVGDDFGDEEFAVFHGPGINTDDIERVSGGRSFFWEGRYDDDMSVAHTLDTQLNVFADFDPKLSRRRASSRRRRLPRQHPARPAARRARAVLERRARRARLDELLDRVGARVAARRRSPVVDVVAPQRRRGAHADRRAEPRPRAQTDPRARAADRCSSKQGRYGACMFTRRGFLLGPGYPLETRRSTRPARATRSPAASSATSTRPRRRSRPTTRFAAPRSTARCMASFDVEDVRQSERIAAADRRRDRRSGSRSSSGSPHFEPLPMRRVVCPS